MAWARIVAPDVPSPTRSPVLLRGLAQHLGAEVLLRILEFELFGIVTPSLQTREGAPFLLDQDRLRLETECHSDRVSELAGASHAADRNITRFAIMFKFSLICGPRLASMRSMPDWHYHADTIEVTVDVPRKDRPPTVVHSHSKLHRVRAAA